MGLRLVAPRPEPDGEPPASGPAPAAQALPWTLDGLFRRYSSYVAAIAMRLLGRDEEVDDVVQDVFLAAVRGVGEVQDPDAIKGWLATVTVRVARRKLRVRRLRGMLRLEPDHSYEDVAAPGATAEHRVLLAEVYRALDGVPTNHRIAWTLRNVEGLPLDRVAAMCGCSLATVKRWIASAQEAIDEVVSK